MSRLRPTARQLLAAARQLGIVVLVDGETLVIRGASPQAYQTLFRHRRALVRRIQADKGAA